MRTVDRFLLFLFSFVAVLSAIVLGYFGVSYLTSTHLEIVTSQTFVFGIVFCVLAVLLLVFSIRFLFGGPKKTTMPSSVLLKNTENGTVRVSLQAINSLVLKCVRSYTQVRDVQPVIVPSQDDVTIRMKLILSPDANIPELTVTLQGDVKEYVQKHSGITVREVLVYIDAAPPTTPGRVE